ncbi:MAG: hypothetical protein BECKG1743F_GA0114225_100843 [Candidatus Kentron sp. G]|nr:MAG: hypothetical protein BECKG1743F_GA0114225_100843 [Candidatus Kentron sp. G]VFN02755.1 MAG: hypothetical protein BECKG1743E_GA0114224_105393 [Candidatus Kentron sp. G]
MLFTDIPVDKLPGIRREFSGPSIDQPVLEIVLRRKQESVVRAGIGPAFALYIEADVSYFPDNRVVDGFIDNNVNRHSDMAHAVRMQGNRMIISQIGNNIKTINLSML